MKNLPTQPFYYYLRKVKSMSSVSSLPSSATQLIPSSNPKLKRTKSLNHVSSRTSIINPNYQATNNIKAQAVKLASLLHRVFTKHGQELGNPNYFSRSTEEVIKDYKGAIEGTKGKHLIYQAKEANPFSGKSYGEPVGTGILEAGGAGSSMIHNVAVDQKHQRKGIGKQIIEQMIQEAKARGDNFVQLTIDDPKDSQAIKFYESLGFKPLAGFPADTKKQMFLNLKQENKLTFTLVSEKLKNWHKTFKLPEKFGPRPEDLAAENPATLGLPEPQKNQ